MSFSFMSSKLLGAPLALSMTDRPASTHMTIRTPGDLQTLVMGQGRAYIGRTATITRSMSSAAHLDTVVRMRTVPRNSCTIHHVSRQPCVSRMACCIVPTGFACAFVHKLFDASGRSAAEITADYRVLVSQKRVGAAPSN